MNWTEIVATVFGLTCVWFTVRQNIWCWPTGLVQVVLYIFVFYEAKLYSDLILQFVYIVLQFYGWYYWLHGDKQKTSLAVTRLPRRVVVFWAMAGICITGGWGYLMDKYSDAAVPYWDGFIAVVSLIAQWLLAKKKLESWMFWIAVDIVAIGVYFYKQLYFTTGLYIIFLFLAIIGFLEWHKAFKASSVNLKS